MRDARTGGISEATERAFRELIAEKPYRSITVSDICERAHLSRKSFYSRFSNKEDIIAVVCSIITKFVTWGFFST